jgi:anti-anti-sigma factor
MLSHTVRGSPQYPPLVRIRDRFPSADVLHVFHEVDFASSAEFETELDALPASRGVVVNLAGCRYIDSSALGVLIRAHRRLGPRLHIVVAPRSQAERILFVTGLYEFLPVCSTLERALQNEPTVV